MKRGDKVKCVDKGHNIYLTEGRMYDVTHGKGDLSIFGQVIKTDEAFQILNDDGTVSYCLYPWDAHATWELVE